MSLRIFNMPANLVKETQIHIISFKEMEENIMTKNRNIRKIASTFTALTLMSVFLIQPVTTKAHVADLTSASTIAEEISLDTEIEPRGSLCSECNVGTINTTYGNWESWIATGENPPCSHGLHGTDKILERSRLVTEVCTYCKTGTRYMETETRRECHGYK